MSDLSLSLDGLELNGIDAGTSRIGVASEFEWPTPTAVREWTAKRFGEVQIPNPKIAKFEIEIPLQLRGTENQILADAGSIAAKLQEAEAEAHIGGIDLTAQTKDATYATTLKVLAGDLTKVQMDFNRLHGVGSVTLKLFCQPWLLGPWATVATGRKPAGVPAKEVQISGLSGDIPGPARITLTNQGATAQQFAMLGLDGRGYASGNKLVLLPSTFDYTTAPLNGTYTAPINEVQTATKSGTISGGTFTLTWEGATTSALAYNASTATVQAALEGLSTIGTGNITVGGSALSSGNMTFTFTGDLAGTDVSLIVLNSSLTGGGSAPITQTTQGVSGYVANTSLQSSWSDFMRTGNQTDTGSFQLWALVYTDANQNEARVRASISIGDTGTATINRSASVPAAGAPVWVNLGPVHAKKRISSGSYRWNATIGAMTVGSVGTDVRVLRLVKLPVSAGVATARSPWATTATLVASDDFNQTAGNATGKTADLGGNWSGAGDANDFTIDATNHRLQRTATADTAGAGRLITLTPNASRAAVSVGMPNDKDDALLCGIAVRSVDIDNFLAACRYRSTVDVLRVFKRVGGTDTVLADVFYGSYEEGRVLEIALSVTGAAWAASVAGVLVTSGVDASLTGTLSSGDAGIYDCYTGASAATRHYGGFRAHGIAATDAAVHPSRNLKWQPDGAVEREAATGTYYGYAAGQQRAGIPLLDPSGTNRLAIASADFNPDMAGSSAQNVPLDYTVEHRPAFAIGRH
jgi:hypothetical protein